MADGKVVIGTALDNSGFEKDAQKAGTSLRSQAAKLAAVYRKQGMSASDAMKKAWSEIERDTKTSSKRTGDSIKKNVGSGADAAVGKLEGLGGAVTGTLGGLAKVTAKMTAGIVAAFGAAAVAITKQSVDAYANYEQLVGGVATLFKDGADEVVSYAEDAFYRAGVSANKYMEAVTSFSASLISALGGDTVQAAKVADMAMVDMADNVSKLGSEMESVRAAYMGFSKGQYQLLDNLKLGYGGTKTEMERLLKDAQARTGVKYDINNLADVYSAIHAIQEKLGIAGATAEEAEKTISGSAAMTKAAWENVLTAISGGGDLDKAINNLVFSISKLFGNLVPVVERALAGIGKLIEQVAPQLVQTVAMALIKAIPSLLNAVYQMIIGLAKGIYQGIVALFTGESREVEAQIKDNASDALGAVTEGYQEAEKATEDAEKAAKRYLAGFDEIQRIGGDDAKSPDASVSTPSIDGTPAVDIVVGGHVDDQATEKLHGVLGTIVDGIMRFIEPLRDIDFSPLLGSLEGVGLAFMGLGQTIGDALWWAWEELLAPLAEWTIEEAAPASLDLFSAALWALDAAFRPVLEGIEAMWPYLEPIVTFIGDHVILVLDEWKLAFEDLALMITEKGGEIQETFEGIGESIGVVWRIAEPILSRMQLHWQGVFRVISGYVVEKIGLIIDHLHGLVTLLSGVLTGDWEKAWEGFMEVVKAPVNDLIGYINAMIGAVVEGINAAIRKVNALSFDVPEWVPVIGGKRFGFDFDLVTAPKIPYLAQGAVLPANKPFLAMVGDQKHGTNVEAPLATIQEAVAVVMEDMIASNMAGHEATVGVLREILSAVLGIEVGDTVIGQAVERYNRQISVIRGGV